MTTHSSPHHSTLGSERAGTLALTLGVLFAAAVIYTYVLSLSADFNPPDWLRVIGLVWIPVGFVGTPVAYLVARTGEGRARGRAGLLIAAVALVAFVALFLALG